MSGPNTILVKGDDLSMELSIGIDNHDPDAFVVLHVIEHLNDGQLEHDWRLPVAVAFGLASNLTGMALEALTTKREMLTILPCGCEIWTTGNTGGVEFKRCDDETCTLVADLLRATEEEKEEKDG